MTATRAVASSGYNPADEGSNVTGKSARPTCEIESLADGQECPSYEGTVRRREGLPMTRILAAMDRQRSHSAAGR